MQPSVFIHDLKLFLDASPTPFHAVQQLKLRFENAGFVEVSESSSWVLAPGQGYFTLKNGSSILAWRQPTESVGFAAGMRMTGAHTDSPCLRVKPQPEMHRHGYSQLGVEVYGGALLNPWFDRDLSLAGRVTFRTSTGELSSQLIDLKKPIAVIPSLAIHLDREANASRSINAQTYLPPILGQAQEKADFREFLKTCIESNASVSIDKVLDYELSFYDVNPANTVGLADEFITSARLDNLLSCYIGMQALIDATPGPCQLLICNDHEEVGSASACGAQGPMLSQWLERVLPKTDERWSMLARSLFVSADNAHGIHPNFADRHDENHGPKLNAGPVVKINSNQRYATNSETSAIFRNLAESINVPVQCFVVRSDMACGSTIGPITATETGIATIDVGVPQFAMHSIREMAGVDDAFYLYQILQSFNATKAL